MLSVQAFIRSFSRLHSTCRHTVRGSKTALTADKAVSN